MVQCEQKYIVCNGEYFEGGKLVQCANEKGHVGDHLLVVREWNDD